MMRTSRTSVGIVEGGQGVSDDHGVELKDNDEIVLDTTCGFILEA